MQNPRPGDHGLVPYVLIFAAMVLPATVGLCAALELT